MLALANFTEEEQLVTANQLRLHGLAYPFTDLVTGEQISAVKDLVLASYRFVWLMAD